MSATTGSFSIGDTTVTMPVKTGSIGPSVVDIGKLYASTGMFTYDPGFTSTAKRNWFSRPGPRETKIRGQSPLLQKASSCERTEEPARSSRSSIRGACRSRLPPAISLRRLSCLTLT